MRTPSTPVIKELLFALILGAGVFAVLVPAFCIERCHLGRCQTLTCHNIAGMRFLGKPDLSLLVVLSVLVTILAWGSLIERRRRLQRAGE